MNNIIGENVRQFKNVIVRNSTIGDSVILADDVFITDSEIGNHCSVERRGMIFNSNIGKYSYTGYNTVVKHTNIGKYCSISWNVSIGGANHDYEHMTTHPFPFIAKYGFCENPGGGYSAFEQPCDIGNDVWIGANAVITRNVKIGDGAVIGASAVVTYDVPPYEIWAGVPAKKIGQRFSDDIIQKLLQLKWWDKSENELKKNLSLFQKKVSLDDLLIWEQKR